LSDIGASGLRDGEWESISIGDHILKEEAFRVDRPQTPFFFDVDAGFLSEPLLVGIALGKSLASPRQGELILCGHNLLSCHVN
jgi:hypothetical protein